MNLEPVDYDPFAENQQPGGGTSAVLEPVDFDPFAGQPAGRSFEPVNFDPFQGSETSAPQSVPAAAEALAGVPDVGRSDGTENVFERGLRDTGVAVAKTVVGTGEALVGLSDLLVAPVHALSGGKVPLPSQGYRAMGYDPEMTQRFLDSLYSKATLEAKQRVGDAEGFKEKVKTAVQNPSTIVSSVGESVGPMLLGHGAARTMVTKAAMNPARAAALGEALITAGGSVSQITQANKDHGITGKQAALATGSAALTGLISLASGRLQGKLGIDDIDVLAAGGRKAASQSLRNPAVKLALSTFFEGAVEELPQSVQEQIANNIAQEKPWDDGVDEAAAMGLLSGMAMGLGGGSGGMLLNRGQTARDGAVRPVSPQAGQANAQSPAAQPVRPDVPVTDEIKAFLDQQSRGQTTEVSGQPIPNQSPVPEQPAQSAVPSFPAEAQSAQANAQAPGEPAIAPGAPVPMVGNEEGPAAIPTPQGARPEESNGLVSGQPGGSTPSGENATASPAPVKRTFEEMQANASRVAPRVGRTVLLTHTKQGKPYTKAQKVSIVSVVDQGGVDKAGKQTEPIVRISRRPAGNTQVIYEDVPLSRLTEPPNVVGQRMRGEYLAGLSKEESRQVAKASKDFNDALYKSTLFTGMEDISAIESSGKDKQRGMALSRHLRIQQQKAAEMLGEPNADMMDPKERARLLPKLRELIARNEVEAVQYQDSQRVQDLKRQTAEEFPAEDIPHEALAWKDGEWYFVSRTDGAVTRLSDGTVEQYDRFDPVEVVGIIEKDSPGYEQAMREFREQRAEEIADKDSEAQFRDSGEQFQGLENQQSEIVDPQSPVKAVNPRTGQTEMIGQEEGGFRLVGDVVSGQPAEIRGQDQGLFNGAEARGRGLDDLDAKGLADLKKVALREGVYLMRGSVDLTKFGAAKVREAIREARRTAPPRNDVAKEIQDGTDETFGLDAGKFRTEGTAELRNFAESLREKYKSVINASKAQMQSWINEDVSRERKRLEVLKGESQKSSRVRKEIAETEDLIQNLLDGTDENYNSEFNPHDIEYLFDLASDGLAADVENYGTSFLRAINEQGIESINPADIQELIDLASKSQAMYREGDAKAGLTFNEFTEKQKNESVLLLKKLLGDQVQVKTIAEKIMTPDGQAALGKYQAGWVTLVEGRADVKDTAAHEAVHAAVDMFLSPAERQRLLDAVDGNEEALAENFVQYAKDRSGALGKVRIVADKLLRFLRTLFVQTSEGSIRAERITKFYEDLMLGRAAKQAGRSGGAAASFRVDPSEEAYQKIQKLYEAAQAETDPVRLEAIRTEFRQIKALAEQVNGLTAPAASLNTPEKRKELSAMSREELQSEAKARGLSPAGTADVIRQRIQNAQDGERVRARSFLQTVQSALGIPKETLERLSSIDPQTYQQMRTSDLVKTFRAWLDEGSANVSQADEFVMGREKADGVKGAMAAALIDRYHAEDNWQAASRIIDHVDQLARENGQFNQAMSFVAAHSGKSFMKSVDKFLAKYKVSVPEDILESIRQDYIAATRINDEAARMDAVAAVIERVASLAPTKWNDWISAYRYTNMLSNPRSHERNVWGNEFQTHVARPLALLAQGDLKGAIQYEIASFKALPNAIQAFKDAWNSGSTGNRWYEAMNSNMSKFESERMRQGAQAVPARKLLLVVGRALEAQDKFFGAMIAQGETYRLVQKGVSPDVAVSAGNKLADDLLYRARIGSDMGDKTKALGVRALDAAGYSLEQLRKTPFIGKPVGWFLPFLRTPVNIGKRLVEFSPLGFVRNPTAGKMTAEQAGRAAAGSAVMLAGAMLAFAGQTTGAPPKDKEERRLWYASGRRPWSVLIGDKWIPMWYFGSFAGALAMPAAIRDSWADDPTTSNAAVHKKVMAIVGSMSAFYGSQTPLQGVGTFLDLAMGRSDYTTATSLAFNAGQFVPASGFLRWANQLMIDPVYRRGGSFEEGFKKDYPFLSQQTRPLMGPEVKDRFGRVLIPAEPVTRKTGSTLLPYDVDTPNPEWDARRIERNTEMKDRSRNNELVDADIRAAIKGDASPDQIIGAIKRMPGATAAMREERSRLIQRAKSKFKDAGIEVR